MSNEAITALNAIGSSDPLLNVLGPASVGSTDQASNVANATNGFSDILNSLVGDAGTKVSEANDLVRQFAVDDNIPVHKVTFALEEARLSVEMMMQVRTRLVEGYREIMNMRM